MRLAPLDIQNHTFAVRLRGFDRDEVGAFLRMLAEDYASLVQENETLRQSIRRLEARLEEHVANERSLKQTLVTAQSVSEDLKRTAMRESEVLVGEAEVQAEKILDAAYRRLGRLAGDIREMKLLRVRLASAIRTSIETHLGLLEGLSEELPEDPVLDGKVAYLARSAKRTESQRAESGGGA